MSVRGLTLRVAGVLCALLGALLLSSAPALAAAPEAPEALTPNPLFATTATLHGVLDPKLVGGPGTFEILTYQFLYKKSKTECQGASLTPGGLSLGEGAEPIAQEISHLEAGTEYTVCLRVSSVEGETLSPKLTFKTATAVAPEPPTLSVETVRATEATLHGVLDPAAIALSEPGAYEFLYKKESPTCTGESTTPPGAFAGNPGEPVEAKLEGLTPNTEYTVCLRAKNDAGDEALSTPPVTFKTALPPEAPETISPANPLTATTATLHGVLNPKAAGNPGTYEFLYKVSATECEGGETSGGSAAGAMAEKVEAKLTGLLPSTTYTFCLLARNEAGETALSSPPVTFTTPPAPPAIEAESSSDVLFNEATVSAQINPDGHPWEIAHNPHWTLNDDGSVTLAP
jgi:hypothetical protein